MLESAFKKKAKQRLEASGWMVIHLIQTNLNGIPDTFILKDSRCVFIEFKQLNKPPKKLQQYRIEKLKQQGFEAFVCDKMEQLDFLIFG